MLTLIEPIFPPLHTFMTSNLCNILAPFTLVNIYMFYHWMTILIVEVVQNRATHAKFTLNRKLSVPSIAVGRKLATHNSDYFYCRLGNETCFLWASLCHFNSNPPEGAVYRVGRNASNLLSRRILANRVKND